jgi:hypothetical protein
MLGGMLKRKFPCMKTVECNLRTSQLALKFSREKPRTYNAVKVSSNLTRATKVNLCQQKFSIL